MSKFATASQWYRTHPERRAERDETLVTSIDRKVEVITTHATGVRLTRRAA